MNLAFVFNQAPTYVSASYQLFDKEFNIKWCFGSDYGSIKEMDHSLLKDVSIYKTINCSSIGGYKLKDIKKIANYKNIDAYILLGEFRFLSMWTLPYRIKLHNPKAKILFWTHGWYGRESLIKKWIKRVFFLPADKILLYGNYARELMIKEGYDEEKLLTIHNSLDHHVHISLRKSLTLSSFYYRHFGNENPVLIFIGRLTKIKCLDLLLSAVSKLKQKGEHYNVVFVGDGDESDRLKKEAQILNIDRQVWFYGACYDEKIIAEHLFNADLCVAPGNIGLTAIHAMSLGCPCISHNDFKWQMPEFEAISEGVTGTFFTRGNADSLAYSISRWFNEKKKLREEVRRACYEEIDKNWTPEFELSVLRAALN